MFLRYETRKLVCWDAANQAEMEPCKENAAVFEGGM